MLEKITFINHINEQLVLGTDGLYANYNDLHDYSWSYTADNNKISAFSKGIVKKTIPIVICCSNADAGIAIRNQLMECAEKDILAVEHGKLIIGDYYLKCFITGSKKGKYLLNDRYMTVSLTVSTDYPSWIKEVTTIFKPVGDDGSGGNTGFFDYSYDFPYDYTTEMLNKTLNNTGFTDGNFKLIIYGAAVNPSIYIGSHCYQVNCTILENEYLVIDSMEKTIVLVQADGTKVNKFSYRNRASYIFERIPAGNNAVTWSGNFGFDIVLLEERSEPKWT